MTQAKSFVDTAGSRETSPELMVAILTLAKGNEELAARIWADPTDAELTSIHEIATCRLRPAPYFCWGASGTNWFFEEYPA